MKTTKTFADKAKAIMKKYPYAKNSARDNEAMMDELTALSEEQEAFKAQSEAAQQPQQPQGPEALFKDGGPTNELDPIWGLNAGIQKALEYERARKGVVTERPEPMGARTEAEILTKPEYADASLNLGQKLKVDMMDNPENYLNALSGITTAATNVANLASIDDARRVQPAHYNPSVKATFYDSAPMQSMINQNMASMNYAIGQKGGDFDSYTEALMKGQSQGQAAIAAAELEGQKINMGEQGRIDKTVSQANLINTQADNEASQAFHQEEIDVDQLRREYRTGIGQNIAGISKDLADNALSKKAGKEYEKLAKLLALKT